MELLTKIQQTKAKLIQTMGRDPSLEELSKHSGIPQERITEILELAQQPMSLEAPVLDDDGGSTMKDVIEVSGVGSMSACFQHTSRQLCLC